MSHLDDLDDLDDLKGSFRKNWKKIGKKLKNKSKKPTRTDWLFAFVLVGRAGFEPATNGLKVRCSTS